VGVRHRALLRRHAAFRLLWLGDAISQAGTGIGGTALQLLAVVTLGASPFVVAVITATGYASWLPVGLPAGVVADRLRRRPLLIGADACRAVLLATIPLAAALNVLSSPQVIGVAALTGALTVLFDVAYPAYLPSLVARAELMEANAALQVNASVAQVGGPGVAGLLVQVLSAPVAVLLDAISFLVSALCISRIDASEPAPEPRPKTRISREIREGFSYVLHQPVLSAALRASAQFNLCFGAYEAVVVLFLVRTAHLSPLVVGVLLSAGGLGGALGGVVFGPAAARWGEVRVLWLLPAVTLPFALLVALAAHSTLGIAAFAIGSFIPAVGIVAFNVSVASFLQTLTPAAMLGRAGASIRFVTRAVLPLGALLGGALASGVDNRTAVAAAASGMAIAMAWIVLSPVRRMKKLVEPA
jgi:MFS family permease